LNVILNKQELHTFLLLLAFGSCLIYNNLIQHDYAVGCTLVSWEFVRFIWVTVYFPQYFQSKLLLILFSILLSIITTAKTKTLNLSATFCAHIIKNPPPIKSTIPIGKIRYLFDLPIILIPA